ncbi:Transposase IS4 family protein [Streptomyces venezuelae]|nr:Transposase IS4 family protein [Streptomyces venezuelae]CUM35655.1 Mobile element protein [Streptomyces venezuelae]
MGSVGAVVTEGDGGGAAARLVPGAVDRRHAVPDPNGRSVAGRARRVRPVGHIYDLFRRWQRTGTWHRAFSRLQSLADAKGVIVWDLSVDSTVRRAHQHAAGARKQGDLQKEPPGRVFTEPRDRGLDALMAGSPPRCTWPSSRARSPCRSW